MDRPDFGVMAVTETIRRATTRRVRQDRSNPMETCYPYHLLLLYRYRLLLHFPEADRAATVAVVVVVGDQVDLRYHLDQGGTLTLASCKKPHSIN